MSLRVAIIEDDLRYRQSLENLLSLTPGFSLAGSFADAPAALEALGRICSGGEPGAPQVVLMDLDLPGLHGIDATRRLKQLCPELQVVVLTVFEDPTTILDAISAGADGYLLKRAPPDELLAQLRGVAAGGSPLTPGVAHTILTVLRNAQIPRAALAEFRLTEREQQVLHALVQGLSYKQAADSLGLSLDTVRTHIRGVYRKLQVHSVAEAVSRAIRQKLV